MPETHPTNVGPLNSLNILWQLSVLAYNISVMMRHKKNKFKQQEHRSFIDRFIVVPAKITKSGHQTELKMNEPHFYKAAWEELDISTGAQYIAGSSMKHKETERRKI